MMVRRIIPNIAAADPALAEAFYGRILGLRTVMDHGWIRTLAAPEAAQAPQLSIASEGGSGTRGPDLSIEVDDLDEVIERIAAAGLRIEYGPVEEPWGVRRLFTRDPFGRLINILAHSHPT